MEERTVVSRLAPLVASGKLDRQSFFKTCALLGVSFATAAAALSGEPAAAASTSPTVDEQNAYSDHVSADVLAFLAEARKAAVEEVSYLADPPTFVQTSSGTAFSQQAPFSQQPPPPKFTKFVQAPTFGKF